MKNKYKFTVFIIFVMFIFAVVMESFRSFRQIDRAGEARKHSFIIIDYANDLMSALIDAETYQHGYLLIGEKSYLEAYSNKHDRISGQLNELRRMVINSDDRSIFNHLDALTPLIEFRLIWLSRVDELIRKHSIPAAIKYIHDNKDKMPMDPFRTGMNAFIEIEKGLLMQHDARLQLNMRKMLITIFTTSLFTLFFVISFTFLIYRDSRHKHSKLFYTETQHLLKIQEDLNKQLNGVNITLEESEEKLAVTLNCIGDAVLATDAEGNVTLLNSVAEQLTGWTFEEAAGRPVDEVFIIINEETRQPAYVPVKDTLEHGTILGLANHTVLISRDGSECAIADSCAPIRNRNGNVIGAVLVFRDVTERNDIEKGLKNTLDELKTIKKIEDEAREYSESIINTVREPLISLDQDLRVVTASRSFYEFFKVKPEETIGQLIYDLGNKQWDIPSLRELLETILPLKTSFDNYEVEHDFTTIGRRIMLLNARQIQRGEEKELIILLAIEDITERKEIEAGLEKTRKELEVIKKTADEVSEFAESIINTVREPLISLDQDLRVVAVSRSFYEFFKVKPEETVGQLIYDLGNKQWDIPSLRELLETILPLKTSFENYEVEHDFASIGKRIMLLNARQIQRESGMERIILLAIEDITERRDAEIVLEKAHEELNELAVELKRTSRVKSEFLANMSHELRTPLNSINGFSEVLYDEIFGPLNEKQKKYVNNVLISGKHLLSLINQILDSAKVESGKMKLVLSRLPMKNLLNEISMLIADIVSKKNLQMQLEIYDDLPDIEGDELKVKEIIYNLLSNAVKFTPEGGEIGMKAYKTGSMIEIVVWDSGIGISHDNMEKIFEGFFRVDTPYSRVTEGTGLGLPLSKKLVELHGGKLSVTSEGLNRGTSVCFTLPIIAETDGDNDK